MSFWKKLFSSSTEEEKKEEAPAEEEKKEEKPAEEEKKEEPPAEEEKKEEPPTEEEKKEETSAEEEKKEETPTEEEKKEETSAEEEKKEETPTEEEKKEETPAEEEKKEEKPAEEEKKEETPAEPPEPWLFQVIHRITQHKVFSEIVLFFFVIIVGYIAILSYGQITKHEGSVSFETLFSQSKMEQICNTFLYGDMEKLVSYVYIERPIKNYSQDNEEKLRKQTAKSLEKEFFQLFKGRDLQLTRLDCEYKEINKEKDTQFVCDCYFKISETEQFILTLEKEKKNQYRFSLAMEKKNGDTTFNKMNALFDYITNGYESETDYKLAEYLTDNEKIDYHAAASYFTMNTNKSKKNATYIDTIETRFKNLSNLQIQIDEVFFSPYIYDSKEKIKYSNLIIHFSDLQTGTDGVLCQPILIGLYGYQPEQKAALCSDGLRLEVSEAMKSLFSY